MTDPAIEAAQRAWDNMMGYDTGRQFVDSLSRAGRMSNLAAGAAREMAKSVQELHVPFKLYPDNEIQQRSRRLGRYPLAKLRTGKVELPPQVRCCSCNDEEGEPVEWPCETAKRVYPSEELGL